MNDIHPVNLNLKSVLHDLSNYECENIIREPNKCLDRFALVEISKIFLESNELDFGEHLAKCFTYHDLDLLRFNIDFGLGVTNPIELITLPHGTTIRKDLIERFLFIYLLYY